MDTADVERELRGLAERVRALEARLGMETEATAAPAAVEFPTAGWHPALEPLGIGVVGLGVAYLLRAAVESGRTPATLGVGLAVLYAMGWLLAAARLREPLYALTSALALGPLLWEGTLRFHAITPAAAAGVLLLYCLTGLTLSRRKDLSVVAAIAMNAGLVTAAVLLITARDVAPFTSVFLAVAAAVEISACLQHWLRERWLAAAAADMAVLLATYLGTLPHGVPPGYAAIPHGWLIGAQIALLVIFLASTIVRTLVRHFQVTGFEMAQCAAAFAIAMWGGLPLAPVMLAAGAACYVVSFVTLERGGGRNFYAYSTFGLLLVLASTRALLTGTVAAAAWSALAIACSWSRRLTLQAHGAIFLGLALMLLPPMAAAPVAATCYAGTRRGRLRIPMFAAAVWTIAVFAGGLAPENLRLAAKLLIFGAALILLPRIQRLPDEHAPKVQVKSA